MIWLKSFLNAHWLMILKGLAIIGGVIAIFRAGRKSEIVDRLEDNIKAAEKAHGIENNNSALGDDDIDKRLRTDWKR